MASSTRKLTSLSCNLKQPSFKKKVQLQAFTGVQPKDCAGRNPMSRDTVMDICKDLVRHAPELEEPRCDFCQKTGQNEGIYLYMKLRYGKKKPVIPQPAVSVAAQPLRPRARRQQKKLFPRLLSSTEGAYRGGEGCSRAQTSAVHGRTRVRQGLLVLSNLLPAAQSE